MTKTRVLFAAAAVALVCVCAIALSLAANGPTVEISNVSAQQGSNVDVAFELRGNPGLASLALAVSYDADALTVESVSAVRKGAALKSLAFTNVSKDTYNKVPLIVSWFGGSNDSSDGTLLMVTFKVNAAAQAKTYAVTAKVDASNEETDPAINTVAVSVDNGSVTVSANAPPTPTPSTAKITVGGVQAAVNQTVAVDFTLSGNPGLASLALAVSYDATALSVDGVNAVRRGAALDGLSFTNVNNDTYGKSPLVVSWFGDSDDTSNGVILTVKFRVLPGAVVGRRYDVSVTDAVPVPSQADPARQTYNQSGDAVPLTFAAGSVTVNSAAVQKPSITIADAAARQGDTVAVAFKLANNPGLAGLALDVKYDANVLTPVSAAPGAALAGLTFTGGVGKNGVYSVSWHGSDADASSGDLLTVTFRVKDDAAIGETRVAAVVTQAFDADESVVVVVSPITDGRVTVQIGDDTIASLTLGPGWRFDSEDDVYGVGLVKGTTFWLSQNHRIIFVRRSDAEIRGVALVSWYADGASEPLYRNYVKIVQAAKDAGNG